MSVDDIFNRTGQAYLCLIHPVRTGSTYRQEIAPVIALSPLVPDEVVAGMIVGSSWRERLLGICMGMAKHPTDFVDPMLRSLRDLRGIAIVPSCAALAVLSRRGFCDIAQSFAGTFDRAAFDGELGWAMDKARHFAGAQPEDVAGRGPNYGQVFEDHTEMYEWVLDGQPGGAANGRQPIRSE
jgi:hypothetical protein